MRWAAVTHAGVGEQWSNALTATPYSALLRIPNTANGSDAGTAQATSNTKHPIESGRRKLGGRVHLNNRKAKICQKREEQWKWGLRKKAPLQTMQKSRSSPSPKRMMWAAVTVLGEWSNALTATSYAALMRKPNTASGSSAGIATTTSNTRASPNRKRVPGSRGGAFISTTETRGRCVENVKMRHPTDKALHPMPPKCPFQLRQSLYPQAFCSIFLETCDKIQFSWKPEIVVILSSRHPDSWQNLPKLYLPFFYQTYNQLASHVFHNFHSRPQE